MLTHLRLSGEKREAFMGGNTEPVAEFRPSFGRVVESLFFEIVVRFRANDVAALRHRVPVFFRRSSRRRCFSSQYPGPTSIGSPEFKPASARDSSSSSAD